MTDEPKVEKCGDPSPTGLKCEREKGHEGPHSGGHLTREGGSLMNWPPVQSQKIFAAVEPKDVKLAPVPGQPAPKPEPRVTARLLDVQRFELEARLWKLRAMAAKQELARRAFQKASQDHREAEDEFLAIAERAGIDISRPFEWTEDGHVVYLGPPRPASVPAPAREKDFEYDPPVPPSK